MITVTKQYRTETGHRLSNYDGKCSHLHGHSYLWEVTAGAKEMTQNGMIVDFKHLKLAMVQVLEPLDHAMVLYCADPLVEDLGAHIHSTLRATNGEKPRLFLWPVNPTAENFAAFAAREIQVLLASKGITVQRVRVWETDTSFAEWNHDVADTD